MADKGLALISAYDKTGLTGLARGLQELGYGIVASGGTAAMLAAAGLEVRAVEDLTGFPEVLGGRVKTLHPAVHAGILARRTDAHLAELKAQNLQPIDVVVCNLYPFVETVANPEVTEAQAIEEIDIGGVTLLRAAAKNYESVAIVCDPADYGKVLEGLGGEGLSTEDRRELALKAFRHTAEYDTAIAAWLGGVVNPEGDEALPGTLTMQASLAQTLRYGENPHQQAGYYLWDPDNPPFTQLQGKELSHNNILDLEGAWNAAADLNDTGVAIVKHNTPCGLATGPDVATAYKDALACDPISAFGGIIAVNREVDMAFVEELGKMFVEVLVAPSYTDDARARLAKKKKKVRVLLANPDRTPNRAGEALAFRNVRGGILTQTPDEGGKDYENWRVVTKRAPSDEEMAALKFAWLAVKHVKSNAIVLAKGTATVGIGGGETSRVDAVHLAVRRAGENAKGSVVGSDAFFPFPDGLEAAVAGGATACVQPGGSIRDDEVIAAADKLGIAMVFTGERHFRH